MRTIKDFNNHALIKEFYKILNSINRAHWEVFCDFLQLSIDAFISKSSPDHPREKDYLQILERYPREDAGKFADMLGCVMGFMQDTNTECLSEIWEVVAANGNLGQFFTPWNISLLTAQMRVKECDWSIYTPNNKCFISEPSCGGGRTLVGTLNLIPDGKLDCVLLHGVDVDLNVCHISALNLLFFNANSVIVHGNTLTLEVWHVFRTIHTPWGAKLFEITNKNKMQKYVRGRVIPTEPQFENLKTIQYELF